MAPRPRGDGTVGQVGNRLQTMPYDVKQRLSYDNESGDVMHASWTAPRRPSTYAAGLLVLLAFVAGALAACSTGDAAQAGGRSTASSPATAVSATATASMSHPARAFPSPPATPQSPEFPPGVPAAARKRSPDGAEAFVVHYMDRWNRAWTLPDPTVLAPLCDLTRAEPCKAAVEDASTYLEKGWRYDGAPASTSAVHALTRQGSLQRVFAHVQQHKRKVIDRRGQSHESYPARRLSLVFYLAWGNTGWLLSDIRPVS